MGCTLMSDWIQMQQRKYQLADLEFVSIVAIASQSETVEAVY